MRSSASAIDRVAFDATIAAKARNVNPAAAYDDVEELGDDPAVRAAP